MKHQQIYDFNIKLQKYQDSYGLEHWLPIQRTRVLSLPSITSVWGLSILFSPLQAPGIHMECIHIQTSDPRLCRSQPGPQETGLGEKRRMSFSTQVSPDDILISAYEPLLQALQPYSVLRKEVTVHVHETAPCCSNDVPSHVSGGS